jgi:hypothetical protein
VLFLHETHEVAGGRMAEFGDAICTTWRPLVEEHGEARLAWFWELTHGTGASYQAVSITAVRDWATWGRLVERMRSDERWRAFDAILWTLRREVTRKLLIPASWSPLQEVDLAAPSATPAPSAGGPPALYLHDTGWPYPGKLDDYVAALGSVYLPQVRQSRMISVEACWVVAPGTGRHHEVVLLQKILDWPRFTELLARGEQGAQGTGWMVEGLRYRERWESKLLRTASWSPRQ